MGKLFKKILGVLAPWLLKLSPLQSLYFLADNFPQIFRVGLKIHPKFLPMEKSLESIRKILGTLAPGPGSKAHFKASIFRATDFLKSLQSVSECSQKAQPKTLENPAHRKLGKKILLEKY
jgi:hypothetical protein